MGRYTGPKARVNRRLNTMVYENRGAVKAHQRREQPPGMHIRAGRLSEYGQALQEKQRIKHYYGLGERQLRRFFEIASKRPGNTGETLLIMCEQRLDNVIRRAGFAQTRPQARQGVVHGHFQVNGHKVDCPSYLVRPGDVITVKPRPNLLKLYRERVEEPKENVVPEWLAVDTGELKITVVGVPGPEDTSCPVKNVNLVTEFLTR
ncbi:MAG: 30S ribosomal protein S4 [Pirellulaceae bacterium]|nr:MAG: 30S ribosomal protein S4 [Pirellulaceae bacterium]GIW95443.1 MAG: 30S ribosomal protein S4 [Pirellulaceae bacterium]GIW96628.1 MAG: 30S ribosomal protein S4 [Pirellulaceae bacterium]